ncbi:MAG: T9SS type A sorting domain-containing protein [Bacteroidetes bacterium]|nr:T9SS type A sorting domain-containing protein [Bacteroidota bacterium]
MRKFIVFFFALLVYSFSNAQFNINAVATNYSQDFNTLTNGAWADNTTLNGWYARTDATATIGTYGANTGTTTAGGLYAFGVTGTNPPTERALGYASSNGFTGTAGSQKGYIGWRLKNNTGASINSITVTWTGEEWRKENNAAAHTLELYYQTGTTVTSLVTGTWTAAPSIFTTPIVGATAPTALDGNAAANRVANISVTITVTIAAGDEIMLRWEDLNDSGNDHLMAIDDVSVNASAPPANTITTGVVTGPPFSLANCLATASGTVDFTSTDVFTGANVFTAQLSDAAGSFAAPVAIGTLALSGNGPSGTINITIPAATAGGAGYKIRVVSSAPVVTGSESAAFTIVQLGACSTSPNDYFRSVATGNWGTASTWESSPDNATWISATLAPTSAANTITIRNGHVVTVAGAASADQVIINNGGTLTHSSGVFTIQDNVSGNDIDIQSGGKFILATGSLSPTFAGSATLIVRTGGLLQVSGTGLTGNGTGVNANNYVYEHQSILEYTLNLSFAASGVTFFPNNADGVNPIFRVSNTTSTLSVGGGSPTIINGTFESNGLGISWGGLGIKRFRNGIIGSGVVADVAGSGDWKISGATASLGGSGNINMSSVILDIGPSTNVTMTSSKTVNGAISLLTNSYITLGAFNLSADGLIAGGSNGYIITNSTGALIKTNLTGTNLIPIGNSTYNPLTITHADGLNWTLRVEDVLNVDDPAFASNTSKAVLREWHITPSVNPPASGADIIFQWNETSPGQTGALYNNTENVQVWHEVANGNPWGNDWIAAGVSQVAGGPATARTASITNWTRFSPFAVSNISGPLPLKLIQFDVQKMNASTARLTWELAGCCLPGARFELEKSYNGASFSYTATINGSTTSRFYYTTDAMGGNRAIYYRLKMIDADGKITFSRIVAVINDSEGILLTTVYPNPVRDKVNITLAAARATSATLELVSVSGKIVSRSSLSLSAGTNTVQTDMSTLTSGVYYLYIRGGGQTMVTALIKQ